MGGGSTSRNFLNGRGVQILDFLADFFCLLPRFFLNVGLHVTQFFSGHLPRRLKKNGFAIFAFSEGPNSVVLAFFSATSLVFLKNGGGVHLTQVSK